MLFGSRLQALIPISDRRPDLIGAVFLDEVNPGDGHFSLIWPGPAVVTGRSGEDAARVGVDEQFWHVGGLEPLAVAGHDLKYINWLLILRAWRRSFLQR